MFVSRSEYSKTPIRQFYASSSWMLFEDLISQKYTIKLRCKNVAVLEFLIQRKKKPKPQSPHCTFKFLFFWVAKTYYNSRKKLNQILSFNFNLMRAFAIMRKFQLKKIFMIYKTL